ncbi:hypothetical protein [Halomarina rubra]|uniref:Uncharacterized protein n=1 Tax=Halomarina rubra TaxID=2071873 RepID=A0ABD6AZB2_9EURY|nr:hypothetical protein [Halomarina rubra]
MVTPRAALYHAARAVLAAGCVFALLVPATNVLTGGLSDAWVGPLVRVLVAASIPVGVRIAIHPGGFERLWDLTLWTYAFSLAGALVLAVPELLLSDADTVGRWSLPVVATAYVGAYVVVFRTARPLSTDE